MALVEWSPLAPFLIIEAALPGLVEAATVVTASAIARCPTSPDGSEGRPSGYLRNSIHMEPPAMDSYEFGPSIDTVCDARNNAGHEYGWDVEFGTKPHLIVSHGSYPLRDDKGHVFGRVVHHPGTTAQPFLRPAVDELTGRVFRS